MPVILKNPDSVEAELARRDGVSIIDLFDRLIEEAEVCRASDIHIDPGASFVRIRFRIDGVLEDKYTFPKNICGEVISRIKILSRLRTDEHQKIQDGRFHHSLSHENKTIDCRVSVAPTYHGENAVVRLLADKNEQPTLAALGFSEGDIKKIEEVMKKTSGMILITGPTGSGKTTTLYTLLKGLNRPDISVTTIEDPIEYAIDDVKQMQVNPGHGLTFADGLRSILRQDPDIIMVGEVRDRETAGIAVNTALTGHLLLSTLHTTDAATTLPRLFDMGVPPYLIASTISLAIGQRLVRKLCGNCKEKIKINGNVAYTGKGCDMCLGSGYRGRICISEVLVIDNEIQEAILKRAPAALIKKIAVKAGMTTMLEDGFEKARSGLTTMEEVLRVIHE